MIPKIIKFKLPSIDFLNKSLKKDYEKAYQNIQKAISLNPNNADAYNNLGTSALNLNKEDEAIAHYNKAISIDPKLIIAYSNLCGLFEKSNNLKEFENILESLKKFIEEGKIRYVGLSNETAWGLSKFLEILISASTALQ